MLLQAATDALAIPPFRVFMTIDRIMEGWDLQGTAGLLGNCRKCLTS